MADGGGALPPFRSARPSLASLNVSTTVNSFAARAAYVLVVVLLNGMMAGSLRSDSKEGQQDLICSTNRKLLARNQLYINDVPVNLTIGVGPRPTDRILAFILRAVLTDDYGFSVDVLNHEHDLRGWLESMNCDVEDRAEDCARIPMIHMGLLETSDQRLKVDTTHVRSAGYLGPDLKLGWFVSSSVVDAARQGAFPDHYKFFRNQPLARTLASSQNLLQLTRRPDSGHWCERSSYEGCNEQGMYVPPWCEEAGGCATLLAAFPHESYAVVVKQIEALHLFVTVAWIGSKFEGHIVRASNSQEAVLFFDYSISALTQSSDTFSEVLFPSCDTAGRIDGCIYQVATLRKVYWDFLETAAGQVVKLLRNIDFRVEEFVSVVKDDSAKLYDDALLQEFACSFLQNHGLAERWSTGVDAYPKIKIHTILPHAGSGLINVIAMAIDDINGRYFKGVILEQNVVTGECNRELILKQYINDITNSPYQLVGVVGPDCNRSLGSLLGVAGHYKHVVMSYMADSVTDEDAELARGFFFRLSPRTNLLASAYVHFIRNMDWANFAAFTDAVHQRSSYVSELQASAQSLLRTFHGPYKYTASSNESLSRVMKHMKKERRTKIIVGDFPEVGAQRIMCMAYSLNMTARHGYVWLLPSWLTGRWFEDLSKVPCTRKQMLLAIDYSFIYKFRELANDDHLMENKMNVSAWKREVIKRNSELPEHAGFAYDAVWALGSGLGELFRANHTFLEKLRHANQDVSGGSLHHLVQKISSNTFQGATGSVHFDKTFRQPEDIKLYEYVGGELVDVGLFRLPQPDSSAPEGQTTFEVNNSRIRWYDNKRPGDGSPTCFFKALAAALNLPCQVAQILAISGIIVGALVTIGGLGAALAYRYYERKMKILAQKQTSSTLLAEYELAEERVRIFRLVGEGAFGKVYFGDYITEEGAVIKVAVKSAKDPKDVNAKMGLLSEAEVMKQFDHVNILRVIGVIIKPNKCQIVTEFMMGGCLRDYLLDRRHLVAKGEIGAVHLTRMAIDICRGLSYLCSKNYVHGDLACRNCLVHESQTIKIADFGFCKNLVDQNYYRILQTGPMPVRWMSPELLNAGVYTTESDIWSFGIVLFEIITFGGHPYHDLDDRQVQDFIRAGGSPSLPQEVSSELEALLLRIWAKENRPSAMDLFETLTSNPELVHPCVDRNSVINTLCIEEPSVASSSPGMATRASRKRIRQTEPICGSGGVQMTPLRTNCLSSM